ncbi:MAG: NAD(P)/FAD-dependent oxidoreductase [Pseudomonadota bacterium]
MTNAHHILIVGGGAAGLALASKLGRHFKRNNFVEITLVDQQLTHIWKPLLHEVAAGSFDPNVNEISFLAQAQRCHFNFRLGALKSINRDQRQITLAAITGEDGELLNNERHLNYDTLVLSVGSISNDFGVPGVAEHCLYLDTTQQAENFHKRLVKTYTRVFSAAENPETLQKLNIAIIGAGATGVELAAQLRQIADLLDSYMDITGQSVAIDVSIIEGADRILPALPEYLSEVTTQQLDKLGINILTGERVTEITAATVNTASGKSIQCNIPVWAAGIKAPPALGDAHGLETNKINQLLVSRTLQTTNDENIFAMGDCAACPWKDDQFIPPRAQSAHQQATLLAKSLKLRLKNQPLPPFNYRDYGSLVSLGHYTTVGNLMGKAIKNVRIEGFIARLVYLSLYKMHQVSLFGYVRTALFTLSNLFRRSVHPEIKLH